MRRARTVSRSGFSLAELIIVVAVLAVLAGIFLPRWVSRMRDYRSGLSCVNCLHQIGLAFKTWSLDSSDDYPMAVSVTNGGTMELVGAGNVWPHFLVMSNELSTPRILLCPTETDPGRKRADTFSPSGPTPLSPTGSRPRVCLTNDSQVSYFIGVDAKDQNPNDWLAGDHNLRVAGQAVGHGLLNLWSNAPVTWDKPRRSHDGYGFVLLADGSASAVTNVAASLYFTGHATNRLALP